MTDREIEYFNTYKRVRDFGASNTADFPKNSAGEVNFKILATETAKVEAAEAVQESNIGRETTVSKEIAALEVYADLQEINRTARSLGVDHPELAALFRMPHGDNYQKLLAAAIAFYDNSAAHESLLVDFALPTDFRADLQSDINDLQAATTGQNEAKDRKTGATGGIAASLKVMNQALRRLRGIVPNVYRNNPTKLSAWASAAHVERPAKKKTAAKKEPEK